MLWVWLIYGPRIFGRIFFFPFSIHPNGPVRVFVVQRCLFGLSGVGVGALGIHDGATDKLDFLTFSFVAVFFFCELWIGRWRWDYKAAEWVHGRSEYVLCVWNVFIFERRGLLVNLENFVILYGHTESETSLEIRVSYVIDCILSS